MHSVSKGQGKMQFGIPTMLSLRRQRPGLCVRVDAAEWELGPAACISTAEGAEVC